MIERFNFYDIYGYVLPGALLLGLFWWPIGLLTATWPPTALSSAVLALVAAYIVGHIIDNLSSAAFPSTFRDKGGRKRVPSDLLFDKAQDEILSQRLWDLKEPIADQIKTDFGINVQANADWNANLKGSRSAAFLKCRNVLIRAKTAAYAEQQQGMYVLMRGCAAAFFLAFALYIGIAVGGLYRYSSPPPTNPRLGLLACVIVALVFAFAALAFQRRPSVDERQARAVVFWAALGALAFAGLIGGRQFQVTNSIIDVPPQLQQALKEEKDPAKFAAGQNALDRWRVKQQIQSHTIVLMLGSAAIAAVLAALCLAAYRAFAVNFAVTVYRDYYRSSTDPPQDDTTTDGDQP